MNTEAFVKTLGKWKKGTAVRLLFFLREIQRGYAAAQKYDTEKKQPAQWVVKKVLSHLRI